MLSLVEFLTDPAQEDALEFNRREVILLQFSAALDQEERGSQDIQNMI
jgi:hypothetical protein